jgi:hypothetical protein
MDFTPSLKKLLNASDNELYDYIWKNTIPMLVGIEERANEDGKERLVANFLWGIAAYHHPSLI